MITIAALPRFIFVWITLGLIVGIQFTQQINPPIWLVSTIGFVLIGVMWLLKGRHAWLHKTIVTLLFACLGLLLAPKRAALVDSEHNGLIMAEVVEVDRRQKEWTKTIVNWLDLEGQTERHRALMYIKNGLNQYGIGDTLIWNGTLEKITNKGNPYEFNAEQYWQSKQINLMGFADKSEVLVRENEDWNYAEKLIALNAYFGRLLESSMPPSAASLAKALILGDKGTLDPETVAAFGNAGAMHVLAVSGLHVGLILQMLLYLFGRFPKQISKYQALWFSVFILIFYAFLTGLSASVCRAVLMFGLLAYSKVSNKEHDSVNILFGSAFLLLLWNPNYIYDIGFQLSYAAMIGIYLLYRPIDRCLFLKSKWMQKAWAGTALGIAATIFTVPLTTYYFHQFPNYFILSNLIILVLAEVILFSGIGYLSTHWVPGLSWCLTLILSFSLLGLIRCIFYINDLPWAVAQGFVWNLKELCALYSLILLGIFFVLSDLRLKSYGIGMVILLLLCSFSAKRHVQQNQQELVVYNNNQLCISVLCGQQLYCFYTHADKREKLPYLVSGYAKAHSAEIVYQLLESNQKVTLSNSNLDFEIEFDAFTWHCRLNGEVIKISFRQPSSTETTAERTIYMPWLEPENSAKGHWLARDGAFHLKWP